ncbi:MAG: hypothetical protein JWQ61_3982, partial [Collimonas fungivorans]|nr:hypothetical protein [Collimonas fungivorans]
MNEKKPAEAGLTRKTPTLEIEHYAGMDVGR